MAGLSDPKKFTRYELDDAPEPEGGALKSALAEALALGRAAKKRKADEAAGLLDAGETAAQNPAGSGHTQDGRIAFVQPKRLTKSPSGSAPSVVSTGAPSAGASCRPVPIQFLDDDGLDSGDVRTEIGGGVPPVTAKRVEFKKRKPQRVRADATGGAADV